MSTDIAHLIALINRARASAEPEADLALVRLILASSPLAPDDCDPGECWEPGPITENWPALIEDSLQGLKLKDRQLQKQQALRYLEGPA